MDRPLLVRRLRIAASVFFALIAVALCVLWVRSYWRVDSFTFRSKYRSYELISVCGRVHVNRWIPGGRVIIPLAPLANNTDWYFSTAELTEFVAIPSFNFETQRQTVNGSWTDATFITFHYWLVFGFSVAGVCMPWTRSRFSLRTILIATTLLAVVLGVTAWAGR
jgi:hypothetical protein